MKSQLAIKFQLKFVFKTICTMPILYMNNAEVFFKLKRWHFIKNKSVFLCQCKSLRDRAKRKISQ